MIVKRAGSQASQEGPQTSSPERFGLIPEHGTGAGTRLVRERHL